MSWNNYENSISDGKPVKLYKFIRGDNSNTAVWAYTSADQDIEVDGIAYKAISISDNGINASSDSSLTINLPANNPIVDLFRGVPPSSPIRVWVYSLHYDDAQIEARLVWLGSVSERKWSEPDRAELIGTTIMNIFARNGLRLTWGRSCNHALFDHNCRKNKNHYAVPAVINSLDGQSLTVTGVTQPNGWFNSGFIEWNDSGVIERRGITEQIQSTISLLGGTSRLTAGMTITLFPGCGRVMSICDEKFGNHLNFGGVPGLPGKSPFDGNKVF